MSRKREHELFASNFIVPEGTNDDEFFEEEEEDMDEEVNYEARDQSDHQEIVEYAFDDEGGDYSPLAAGNWPSLRSLNHDFVSSGSEHKVDQALREQPARGEGQSGIENSTGSDDRVGETGKGTREPGVPDKDGGTQGNDLPQQVMLHRKHGTELIEADFSRKKRPGHIHPALSEFISAVRGERNAYQHLTDGVISSTLQEQSRFKRLQRQSFLELKVDHSQDVRKASPAIRNRRQSRSKSPQAATQEKVKGVVSRKPKEQISPQRTRGLTAMPVPEELNTTVAPPAMRGWKNKPVRALAAQPVTDYFDEVHIYTQFEISNFISPTY